MAEPWFDPYREHTYIATGTNVNGCTNTATVIVTVNSVPSITVTSSSPLYVVALLPHYGFRNNFILMESIRVNGISGSGKSNRNNSLYFDWVQWLWLFYNLILYFGSSANAYFTISASKHNNMCRSKCHTHSRRCHQFHTGLLGNITGSLAVVSPTNPTLYTLTGDSNGCITTTNLPIFVNQLPVIPAGATPTNICNGAVATLTASGGISPTCQ